MKWTLIYNDGSANGYRIDGDATSATFKYSPVRPEHSSTGMYSGGDPRQGTLDASTVAKLREQLSALEQDTQHHVTDRLKGSGQFTIIDERGERSFMVWMGVSHPFDDFLRALPGD